MRGRDGDPGGTDSARARPSGATGAGSSGTPSPAPRRSRAHVRLTEDERRGLALAEGTARVAVTPYYASLIDAAHPSCPVRIQAIPTAAEFEHAPGDLRDPLGEDVRRPVPRHRAPLPGPRAPAARDRSLRRLLPPLHPPPRHLRGRRRPLPRGPRRGGRVPARPPVDPRRDRVGRRSARARRRPARRAPHRGPRRPAREDRPARDPRAGGPARCGSTRGSRALLRRHAPLFVVTHFNHPKECTDEARAACETLVDAGVPVENQTVLLRGVNSSARILKDLFERLLEWRVRPYYLHQGDLAEGTGHLRTPLDAGVAILEALRGHTSGLAIPHLAVDLPGGGGKVTLQPDYVVGRGGPRPPAAERRGRAVPVPGPARPRTSPARTTRSGTAPEPRRGLAEAVRESPRPSSALACLSRPGRAPAARELSPALRRACSCRRDAASSTPA